jgi:CheY-like chemotaxis protein
MRPLGSVVPAEVALVADDARVMRMLLRTWLERLGYIVMEAGDAAQAIATLEREHVDVMISDVQMPGMSGLKLLEYVRQHPRLKALPVLMCSTLGSDSDRNRADLLGATAYLSKPVDYHGLLRALAKTKIMQTTVNLVPPGAPSGN